MAHQAEKQFRRPMPTGGASMPTAAVMTAEPMTTAAVELTPAMALPMEFAVEPASERPGPGRRSG